MSFDGILALDALTRDFPGVRALDNVSFAVGRGEVHALVGENGAGKSTLMHILGGVIPPSSGRILLDGRPVTFTNPREAQRRGIRVVFQELSIVPNLSAAENIFANCQPVDAFGFVRRRELNRKAAEMIALFGEDIDPDRPASELPIGKRQILEILKALTFEPRVVLLDEPTSSLTGVETETLFSTIRKLRESGVSFVFISHHLPEVFAIADKVTVLRDGACQGTFDIDSINEDELIARMVGRTIGDVFGAKRPFEGEPRRLIDVSGLTRSGEFEDVTFHADAGEIVGFAGLVGAGRTELARSLFGLSLSERGTVAIDGKTVAVRSVRDAIGNGLCYLTEDRKQQGLFFSLAIRDNLAAPSLERFVSGADILDDAEIDRYAATIRERFTIVAPSVDTAVGTLSGGNQQKVLLGMWMGLNPKVFIADEPTRGVDVGAKEEIYAHIRARAAGGASVILLSSDLNEILGLSDRIYVMRHGRIVHEFASGEATEESVISYAIGAGETATCPE